MSPPDDPYDTLTINEFFRIDPTPTKLVLKCLHCPEAWQHPLKPLKIGTLLKLLAHAALHERNA
jgi:hypothetical protein